MKRLEIVHIRLYGPLPESLIRDIQESVADEGDQVQLRIYRRTGVSADLSLHLHMDAQSDDTKVTELGLRLTDALGEYGLVKCTQWSEVHSPDIGQRANHEQ